MNCSAVHGGTEAQPRQRSDENMHKSNGFRWGWKEELTASVAAVVVRLGGDGDDEETTAKFWSEKKTEAAPAFYCSAGSSRTSRRKKGSRWSRACS